MKRPHIEVNTNDRGVYGTLAAGALIITIPSLLCCLVMKIQEWFGG